MQADHPIIVIGAGPAGLSAAENLSAAGFDVVVYDRMPSVARKFLMAGRSGLNLTHAEDLVLFLSRYGKARDWLEPEIRAFPPQALRDWAEALGQPCFAGSSGRVFPQTMKASPLLRAWIERLKTQGVTFALQSRWIGWGDGESLLFETSKGPKTVVASAVVLALGGGSWPRLGSDGDWTRFLPSASVSSLRSANCGFRTGLPDLFHERFEGEILHSVRLSALGENARGDITIARYGIEGAPVYRLSGLLREAIATGGALGVRLDLRPALPADILVRRLAACRPRESQSNRLRRLGFQGPVRFLLREAGAGSMSDADLAGLIKSCPLTLTGPDSLARAISSAGGVRRIALDGRFMLLTRPGVFVAGEMLDWEAPTGGYLLQACFATGRAAAEGVKHWLSEQSGQESS